MNYGQMHHNTAPNRALGLWPFDAVSDWWNSTPATAGTGATSITAQQAALAQQNALIIGALNQYRDKPTPPPWMVWVKYGGLVIGLTAVTVIGVRRVRQRKRRR